MKHNQVSIMFSGGLDSLIAYHYALKNNFDPFPIYVNMGHPYARDEMEAIEKSGIDVKIINMAELYPILEARMSNQIIPSRNVMLAVIGSMFSPIVWLGALEGEQNGKERDKSHKFFQDATSLLTYTNNAFQPATKVETPFYHMTKAQTLNWALNNMERHLLHNTTSCYYTENGEPCGSCLTCYKRWAAFKLNGIEEGDVQNYRECHPSESPYAKEIDIEIEKAIESFDFSRFTESRITEWKMLKNNETY